MQITVDGVPTAPGNENFIIFGSRFKIKIQTSTKVRIENFTFGAQGQLLTNITDITWFALKLGV